MQDVSTYAPAAFGPTSHFLRNEILRVGAPVAELKSALAFVASDASVDPRAYEALSPRMRRLVDLMAVAGHDMVADIPETVA